MKTSVFGANRIDEVRLEIPWVTVRHRLERTFVIRKHANDGIPKDVHAK